MLEQEFDDLDGLFDLFDGRDRYPEDQSYGIDDDDIEDELEALRIARRAKRIKAGIARRGLDYKGEDS